MFDGDSEVERRGEEIARVFRNFDGTRRARSSSSSRSRINARAREVKKHLSRTLFPLSRFLLTQGSLAAVGFGFGTGEFEGNWEALEGLKREREIKKRGIKNAMSG